MSSQPFGSGFTSDPASRRELSRLQQEMAKRMFYGPSPEEKARAKAAHAAWDARTRCAPCCDATKVDAIRYENGRFWVDAGEDRYYVKFCPNCGKAPVAP